MDTTRGPAVLMSALLMVVLLVFAVGCGDDATDADGDGWTDAREQSAGTNPYKVDSDGDGYWDPLDPDPRDADNPRPQTTTVALDGTPTPAPNVLPELRVHFIDVGQGDAILLDLGELEVLIDGGAETATVEERLLSYLNTYVDGTLEAVIATLPRYDHVGGLIPVLDNFDVGHAVWQNGDTNPSCGSCMTFLERARVTAGLDVLRRGHVATVGNPSGVLQLRVLHPDVLLSNDFSNNSIVLSLTYGEVDFLFTGDAEQEAENSMLAAGVVSDIDVLKVGNHGSSTSSSRAFLKACKPEVAIYMAGGEYGHPPEVTISALESAGAEVYGTDVDGTIVVTTNGVDYSVQP